MSRRDLVVALDASTTAAKAVVWDSRGTELASARANIALENPAADAWEQDAESWWSSAREALRLAAASIGGEIGRLAALSIANQRETFVVTDADGKPLRKAVVWMDARCRAMVARTAAEVGADHLLELTGKPPSTTPSLYKLRDLLEREPELRRRDMLVLDVHGFLVRRLTGRLVTSLASADPLGLVDLRGRRWARELLALCGLEESNVAELVAPGTVVGALTPEAAELTGLPAGLPVVAGAGDGQAAGVGAGITGLSRAYLNLGTALVSGVASERYATSLAFRTLYGARDRTYFLETDLQGGTFTLSWLAERLLGSTRPGDALAALERSAADLPPGAEGLVALPYWNGVMNPYWDDVASGALVGLRGHHGPAHVHRAVLEGLALEQRLHSDGVQAETGTRIEEFVVMGGGSRSDLFCRIVADATGRSVVRAGTAEATALGVGILAAVAVGVHGDLEGALAAMTHTAERFEPGPDRERYARLFDDVYRGLYAALRPAMANLVALQGSP